MSNAARAQRATVNQLMDRYFEVLDVEATTRGTYEGYVRNHVRPLLGTLPVARLNGEVLDSFYAQLRRCRAHCRGRKFIEHRTSQDHECNDRCRPHVCRPLADSSIKQIHGILSGACKRAVWWPWIGTNPVDQHVPQKTTEPRGVPAKTQVDKARRAAMALPNPSVRISAPDAGDSPAVSS